MRQIKQLRNINQDPREQIPYSTVKKAKGTQTDSLPTLGFIRSSSQPSVKGKVMRGVNYDPGSLSIFTKAKIKDLESKL